MKLPEPLLGLFAWWDTRQRIHFIEDDPAGRWLVGEPAVVIGATEGGKTIVLVSRTRELHELDSTEYRAIVATLRH